jgi:predicted site-specific integrase-resolvase
MNFDEKNSKVLLTKKQVAERLQVSPRTVENFTNRGILPKICLGTKTVRYPSEGIDRVLRESTVNSNLIERDSDL